MMNKNHLALSLSPLKRGEIGKGSLSRLIPYETEESPLKTIDLKELATSNSFIQRI